MTKNFTFFMEWNWTSLLFGLARAKEESCGSIERIYLISIGMLSFGITTIEYK